MSILVKFAVIGLLLAGGGNAGDAGAGDMNEDCLKVVGCMTSLSGIGLPASTDSSDGAMTSDPGNMLDLTSMQSAIVMLCGPLKEMLQCMEELTGCPGIMESMEQSIENNSTLPGMSYDKIKEFISDTCTKMPSDFGTNTCVKEQLTVEQDDECMKEATKGSQQGAQPTCSDVGMMVECMSLHKCGSNYDHFMRESMGFLTSAGLNMECDLTSGSYGLSASIFTVIIAVLSLVKLF